MWRKGFDGNGKATYYGWVPLDKTPEIYSRAWFSVNLQGITARPGKTSLFGSVVADPHAVYSGGSWNNTESESLYYGAIPVLHKQVLKSNLPKNLILTVERAEELPDLLARKDLKSWVFDLNRVMEARCWVQQHQDPVRLYREMKEALFV